MFHEVNSLVGHYEKLELCYPCWSYYSFLPFTSLLPQPVQVSCRDISSHRLCFLSCQKQTQMNLCWPRDISQLTISFETDQFSFQWKPLLTNIDTKRELWQEYKHRDYQNREKKKTTTSNIFNFFFLMNLILLTTELKLLNLSNRLQLYFFCLFSNFFNMQWYGVWTSQSLQMHFTFTWKKQASFWWQEHSFPPPTSLIYYSYLNVSIQLFHLASFFSYVANWNQSLVKLHSLVQLGQNFTTGGKLFMWLLTFLPSTQTVVFQDSNEIIYMEGK